MHLGSSQAPQRFWGADWCCSSCPSRDLLPGLSGVTSETLSHAWRGSHSSRNVLLGISPQEIAPPAPAEASGAPPGSTGGDSTSPPKAPAGPTPAARKGTFPVEPHQCQGQETMERGAVATWIPGECPQNPVGTSQGHIRGHEQTWLPSLPQNSIKWHQDTAPATDKCP